MTHRRAAATAVALVFVMTISDLEASTCPEGTRKVGVRRTEAHDKIVLQDECAPIHNDVPKLNEELKKVNERVAVTRAALRGLSARSGQLQADIDEWVRLSSDARTEAHVAILDIATILGLEFLGRSGRQGRRLAEGEDRRLIGVLPVVDGTPLQKLRAEVIRRLEAARTDRDVVKVVEAAGTSSSVVAAVGGVYVEPKVLQGWATAAIEILQPFVRDPFLGLLLADARLAEPVLYGWVAAYKAKAALTDLSNLGDANYRAARVLTRTYLADLKKRDELVTQGATP